ncbi:Rho-related GTP-binding protein RhoC [Lamellibrachia satsuma]|nr:Rho-related GTP-binding protein RhoC [Lamellibrachia satsuma]
MGQANPGSGEPWARRTRGQTNHGSGKPWVRRTLGQANPGSGEPWVRRTLGQTNPGPNEPWVTQTLGQANPGPGEPWVRRNMGQANPGSCEPWARRTLGQTNPGSGGSWIRGVLGQAIPGSGEPWINHCRTDTARISANLPEISNNKPSSHEKRQHRLVATVNQVNKCSDLRSTTTSPTMGVDLQRKPRMVPPMVRKKLVVVGDGECGKTCLLLVYCRDEFPEHYVPTIFENYIAELELDGHFVELALWDTAGQEDYDRLRPLSYPDTDVLLLCFAVDNPDSFQNVTDKWVPELNHFCPRVPVVLVCTKVDLRDNKKVCSHLAEQQLKPVSRLQGRDLARKINAHAYMECSARTQQGVQEVFELATRVSAAKKSLSKRASCRLL